MERIDELFTVDPDSWIRALQPYQRNMINRLYIENGNYEDAAKAWLTASMSTTVPFGTEKDNLCFLIKF